MRTGRLKEVDQAHLSGVMVCIIEDATGDSAGDHGDVVGLGRVSGP